MANKWWDQEIIPGTIFVCLNWAEKNSASEMPETQEVWGGGDSPTIWAKSLTSPGASSQQTVSVSRKYSHPATACLCSVKC